ncbi:MAG TPA: phytanoyl-CoA dioxygenase family protein [Micropepsaceae bacterium]|nr:phytanoyl-CoA dioxygenase family protein [Micropepsaceae bacterium]
MTIDLIPLAIVSPLFARHMKLKLAHLKTLYHTATDSRYRRHFLQRRTADPAKRMRLAATHAARLPKSAAALPPEVSGAAAGLASDGFVMTPGIVKSAMIDAMRSYFSAEPCRDPYRPELGQFIAPGQAPKGTHVAFFPLETVARAPHAMEIANHPVLLAIAEQDLGAKPLISALSAWWSLPAGDGTAQHAENYHRDVDDLDWVKYFLYLTDVDESAGPHLFIRGSHLDPRLTTIRRYQDEEVHAVFGKEREVRFTGPAGTSFLEKTYGLHRGLPVVKTPRLIFQVFYSLRPVIYGPRRPLFPRAALAAGADPYVNSIYFA